MNDCKFQEELRNREKYIYILKQARIHVDVYNYVTIQVHWNKIITGKKKLIKKSELDCHWYFPIVYNCKSRRHVSF